MRHRAVLLRVATPTLRASGSREGHRQARSRTSAGSRAVDLGGDRPTWSAPAPTSSIANSSPPIRAALSPARMPIAQRVGHRAQDLVAGEVPERVVDLLEAVEVEHDERRPLVVAPAARELGGEVLLEAAPVPEPGQRVALGEVGQVQLHLALLGHVGARADHRVGLLLAGSHEGARADGQPAPRAVGPLEAGDLGQRTGLAQAADQRALPALQGVAALVQQRPALRQVDQRRRVGVEELARGLVEQLEPAVGVEEDDRLLEGGHQRADLLPAVVQRGVALALDADERERPRVQAQTDQQRHGEGSEQDPRQPAQAVDAGHDQAAVGLHAQGPGRPRDGGGQSRPVPRRGGRRRRSCHGA